MVWWGGTVGKGRRPYILNMLWAREGKVKKNCWMISVNEQNFYRNFSKTSNRWIVEYAKLLNIGDKVSIFP